MTEIERLLAIEEIQQLKARYFLGIDFHDWDLWRREVWAPDARLEVPELGKSVGPRDELIAWVKERTGEQVSVHHGHMPIIEIMSDTTATGLWAMEDRLYRPKGHPDYEDGAFILGFGHYHETYVKLDVGWRIRSTRLTRLRVTRQRLA
ncbi:MAG: nuclear transport factor 2 family protein [Novosphingobium sp.]|nr:nuclear transport factor 2 family protein [Novosphingobium sp.]